MDSSIQFKDPSLVITPIYVISCFVGISYVGRCVRIETVIMRCFIDWGEEASKSRTTVPLKGITVTTDANFWGETDNFWDDDQFWDEGSAPDDMLSTKGYSPTGKGRGFFLSTTIDTKVDFLVNRLIL